MSINGKLYDDAIARVRESLPLAAVRQSGAAIRVDVDHRTAYVLPEIVNELDAMDIAYLVEGLIHGRRA